MRQEEAGASRKTSYQLLNSSIINFDFSGLGGVTITSAKLSLGAKPYNDEVFSPRGYLGSFRDPRAHYVNGDDLSRGNSFNLERVITSWDGYTNINMDDIRVSPVNKVLVGGALNATCTDLSNLECGPLVQDIINSSGRNGIRFAVPEIVFGGGEKDARRSRSFYSGFGYAPSEEDLCKQYAHTGYLDPPKPTLKIYFTTSKDTCVQLCRPNIDSSSVNPYIWGIYGNWRMNRTYNYYGSRKESDAGPGMVTDARTDEEIQSFVPYWAFNPTFLAATVDTGRWVWNSEITQFNRKGMEVENKDPLGRYNSGQYGYNQSIPVAVTQNSKLRNAVFDGFEDYDYKTNSCNPLCATAKFIDFVADGGIKDSISRHTGKYSLRLAGNQTTTTVIPIVSAQQDSLLLYFP